MARTPEFGFRIEDISYKEFFDISTEALALYRDRIVHADSADLTVQFWLRFGYYAESTSWAIRMLTSWEETLPAIVLARVRLEQLIVCSYLIYENPEVALGPYLMHFQLERFFNSKEAMRDPELKKFLDVKLHERLSKAAVEIENARGLTDGDSRKWTKLDLQSMARKRDNITKTLPNISHVPLERSYIAFYRDFSSLVHSGAMALSPEFLDAVQVDGTKTTLKPLPVWGRNVMMTVAHWDTQILQALFSQLPPQIGDEQYKPKMTAHENVLPLVSSEMERRAQFSEIFVGATVVILILVSAGVVLLLFEKFSGYPFQLNVIFSVVIVSLFCVLLRVFKPDIVTQAARLYREVAGREKKRAGKNKTRSQ